MFIRNVTVEDDSTHGALGSYECYASVVGDANVLKKHGFSVSVIRSKSYTLDYCSLWFLTLTDSFQ